MQEIQPLAAAALCWRCDPQGFQFNTTDDLEDLDRFLGQPRALNAVQFGIGIRRDGYNLFVIGPPGFGKRAIVQRFLKQKSAAESRPPDWVYVNNFADSREPRALPLPAGRGRPFVADMDGLIEDLQAAIPAALEVEEHKTRVQQLEQEAKARQEQAFQELARRSLLQGIQLVRTPSGFMLAPVREGEVLGPDDFEKLPETERLRIQQIVLELQQELRELLENVPQWRRETRKRLRELNREATRFAINHTLASVKQRYADLPDLAAYLNAVETNMLENADDFNPPEEEPALLLEALPRRRNALDVYRVNLIVDNSQLSGAPVIYEEHPSHGNLVGRVEHESYLGTLLTRLPADPARGLARGQRRLPGGGGPAAAAAALRLGSARSGPSTPGTSASNPWPRR